MPIVQKRRRFLTNLAFAGAAGLGGFGAGFGGGRKTLAAEHASEPTSANWWALLPLDHVVGIAAELQVEPAQKPLSAFNV